MQITNARYVDASRSMILAEVNGQETCIPVDPRNRHYQDLIRLGVTVAEPEG